MRIRIGRIFGCRFLRNFRSSTKRLSWAPCLVQSILKSILMAVSAKWLAQANQAQTCGHLITIGCWMFAANVWKKASLFSFIKRVLFLSKTVECTIYPVVSKHLKLVKRGSITKLWMGLYRIINPKMFYSNTTKSEYANITRMSTAELWRESGINGEYIASSQK